MLRRTLLALSMSALGLTAESAYAQAPAAPTAPAEPPPDGLSVNIDSQGTFALTDMSNVVGQQSGTTVNFGLKFNTDLGYRKGKHQFMGALNMQVGLTQTPLLDGFVKTADNLKLSLGYIYRVRPWIGPFIDAAANAPVLRGFDLRPTPTTYQVALADGTTSTQTSTNFTLTDPFFPLTLVEMVGLQLNPYRGEKLDADLAAGVASKQTFASGQFVLVDNPDTPNVEVREIDNFTLIGSVITGTVKGALIPESVSYGLTGTILIPFWSRTGATEVDSDASIADQTNMNFGVNLGIKLSTFASLEYQFSALMQPQLIDEWQMRHGLMLNLGASYKKAPKAPKKEEPKKDECSCNKDAPPPAK